MIRSTSAVEALEEGSNIEEVVALVPLVVGHTPQQDDACAPAYRSHPDKEDSKTSSEEGLAEQMDRVAWAGSRQLLQQDMCGYRLCCVDRRRPALRLPLSNS